MADEKLFLETFSGAPNEDVEDWIYKAQLYCDSLGERVTEEEKARRLLMRMKGMALLVVRVSKIKTPKDVQDALLSRFWLPADIE